MPSRSSIAIHRDVAVPMSDGVVLRADVWLADDGRPRPVLLQRSAYDRAGSGGPIHNHGLEPLEAVDAGFVLVKQDTRGRFGSDGALEPFVHEARDGVDTIAWVRRQPFCDGRLMMYGGSYNGALQLHAASLRPTGELRDELLGMLADPWSVYARLPLEAPSALTELLPAYGEWLTHADRDAYWRQRSAVEALPDVAVPALHVGGWSDIFLAGTLRSYDVLRRSAREQAARAGQRLLVGPWAHEVLGDHVGEVGYGPAAGDLGARQLSFFRAVLDDTLDDVPPVSLFVMGRNAWQDEEAWPPPRMRDVDLHLRSANGEAGRLSPEPPGADEPPAQFVYDPADPVPTAGGATFLPGVTVGAYAGPRDQRALRDRPDVVAFTGEPLDGDLQVVGDVVLTLYAATDAPDTDWTAKLVVVEPDGTARNVVDGILRARYRAGTATPKPIEPGVPLAYRIELGATALRVQAGSRLQLHVSSSNFPRFDRNPNHGGHVASAGLADLRVARQTIFLDASRPSRLTLPVTAGRL